MIKEYDLFLPWKDGDSHPVFAKIAGETLFRLNPHWIISEYSGKGQSFSAELIDHETEKKFSLTGNIVIKDNGCPEISASNHQDLIWESIHFFLKEGNLHAQVAYHADPPEEQERQVVLWLRSIKEYLRLYTAGTVNAKIFRFLMNRVILKMTPSQRKICLMLIRVTILEIIAILLILVGWFFIFR